MINKNHGKYLDLTIQSYLNQSHSNIEIIVIDGGSTDNSIEVMKKYKSVKVYSSEDQSGAEAFAKGLKYCNSNLVMFATSNDVLVSRRFVGQAVNFLNINHDYGCVFGNVVNLNFDEKIGETVHPYDKKGYFNDYKLNFKRWIVDYESFHELAAVFRKEIVLSAIGDLNSYSRPINELNTDMFLQLRFGFFSNGYRAKYIDSNVIAVRDHTDRVSVESRIHFSRHLQQYSDQLESFRSGFLKKNYCFVSPSTEAIESLGVPRQVLIRCLIISQSLLTSLKKKVKLLIKLNSR